MAADVIRCPSCKLNQFKTLSGLCRRCTHELMPKLLVMPSITLPRVIAPRVMSRVVAAPNPNGLQINCGSIIKLLRLTYGWSQSTLAREVGTPRTYISKVENNGCQPTVPLIKRFAQAFKITPLGFMTLVETSSVSATNQPKEEIQQHVSA